MDFEKGGERVEEKDGGTEGGMDYGIIMHTRGIYLKTVDKREFRNIIATVLPKSTITGL